MNKALTKAIDIVGGQSKLAETLTKLAGRPKRSPISQGHVWGWLHRGKKRVPAQYCRHIESATLGEVTAAQLRPDIFGAP